MSDTMGHAQEARPILPNTLHFMPESQDVSLFQAIMGRLLDQIIHFCGKLDIVLGQATTRASVMRTKHNIHTVVHIKPLGMMIHFLRLESTSS
jgi:hypothetical protein